MTTKGLGLLEDN